MFESIAAIDIGSSSIKVVAVKTGFKDFQVKTFAYEDIDFSIDNAYEAKRLALEKLIIDENLINYKIVTNLPMEKAIIRNITFPFSDVEKIAEAIPFEAEDNIPFKLEDLSLDFQSLKSPNKEEGRILLAAVHKESLYDFLNLLDEQKIKPFMMGMESNALYECYRYFNKIEGETIIQLDIGNNKTIINIISDNSLMYTRSISLGIGLIHKEISDIMGCTYREAVNLLENLNLDVTSFDNNVQRGIFNSLNIPRPKFKSIFNSTTGVIDDLIEQIVLTIKAFNVDFGQVTFNRILLSGGGANIPGIGTVIAGHFEVPAVPLPFLEEYSEQKIRSQFPIAFGCVLAYINKKMSTINFLKGEFIPDLVSSTKKIYYLAAGFLILSVLVLIINLIIAGLLTSKSNTKFQEMIAERYQRYFMTRLNPKEEPLAEAGKLLKKEQKELEIYRSVISEDSSLLEFLMEIISYFPKNNTFDLKNIVVNDKIVRLDGVIAESKYLDEFKEKLQQSKKFDSINLTIKYSRKNEVNFSMQIKQKLDETAKPGAVKPPTSATSTDMGPEGL